MAAVSSIGGSQQIQLGEDKTENSSKRNLCGSIEHEICSLAKNVFEGLRLFFVRFCQIRKNPSAFGRVLQLGRYAFSVVEIAFMKPGSLANISLKFRTTKNVMDAMQVLDCIHDYGKKNAKRDAINTLGYASMLIACLGTGAQILDQCKLLSLGKIAEKMGSIPVLGSVTRIGLNFGQIITGFVAFGYSCFGVDAIERIIDAKNGNDRRQAWIDLAWFVTEVTVAVFVVFAGAYIGGVIALGSIAATLGLVSYLHGLAVKEKRAEIIAPSISVKV